MLGRGVSASSGWRAPGLHCSISLSSWPLVLSLLPSLQRNQPAVLLLQGPVFTTAVQDLAVPHLPET